MAYRSSQHTTKRSSRRNGSGSAETSRATRGGSARTARPKDAASEYAYEAYDEEPEAEEPDFQSEHISAREERRRRRAKQRAGKMFDRQMARSASVPDQEDGAPRAALYEGKMGSSHRKATRMQRSSEAGPVTAKVNPAGWFSNIDVNPRALGIATAVICLVLVGVFLYTPAQQYYQAQRERDRLAAEYAAIEERNALLDEQNDSLASDAGLEDAIRQKYGYISPDEQMAVVTGLDEEETAAARGATDVEGNVLSSSVKAPEEWYTPILDAFFGVD